MWQISTYTAPRTGQDDIYIDQIGLDEYIVAVLQGHGQDRSVVEHTLKRLPALTRARTALDTTISVLASETQHFRAGACISMAHLTGEGQVHMASLGDAPILWGPTDFQSMRDMGCLAPHSVRANTRERTRIMLKGGVIRGDTMLSPCGTRTLATTRSLGDCTFEQLIDRTPEYGEAHLSHSDFILLCTSSFCDLRLPITKTCIDWQSGIAQNAPAESLVDTHRKRHGMRDDTSLIVAYRY